jgi:prepilin-type processing-associated H-X9-DG protein
MFEHDNSDTFPPAQVSGVGLNGANRTWLTFISIGGREARSDVSTSVAPPYLRPLFSYLKPSQLFQCPDDHGAGIWIDGTKRVALNPSCWDIAGCSYMYNVPASVTPYHKTRLPQEDPYLGIAGKKVGWVPDPARFILMYEPPARSFLLFPTLNAPMHSFQHWHYSAGDPNARDITNSAFVYQMQLAGDGRKFVSPILFVDGHVAKHDFTPTIKMDPDFVFEPTKDWIWYKSKSDIPVSGQGKRQP